MKKPFLILPMCANCEAKFLAKAAKIGPATNWHPGEHVKLMVSTIDRSHTEKFWALITKVTRVEGVRITAMVDNDMQLTAKHGLAYRDIIEFNPDRIIGLMINDTPVDLFVKHKEMHKFLDGQLN